MPHDLSPSLSPIMLELMFMDPSAILTHISLSFTILPFQYQKSRATQNPKPTPTKSSLLVTASLDLHEPTCKPKALLFPKVLLTVRAAHSPITWPWGGRDVKLKHVFRYLFAQVGICMHLVVFFLVVL